METSPFAASLLGVSSVVNLISAIRNFGDNLFDRKVPSSKSKGESSETVIDAAFPKTSHPTAPPARPKRSSCSTQAGGSSITTPSPTAASTENIYYMKIVQDHVGVGLHEQGGS